MPAAPSRSCTGVAWNMPLPGLSISHSSPCGASASMISLPGSPATRMRPIGPTSPMRSLGWPRLRLAAGQSDKSGRCASRVCSTRPPAERQAARTRLQAGTMADRRDTSLPSVSPNPPGSMKSRCMSMTTSAVCRRSNSNAKGAACTHLMPAPPSKAAMDCPLGRPHPRAPPRPCTHPAHGAARPAPVPRAPNGPRSSPGCGRPARAIRRGLR